jgi:hypothetical protein
MLPAPQKQWWRGACSLQPLTPRRAEEHLRRGRGRERLCEQGGGRNWCRGSFRDGLVRELRSNRVRGKGAGERALIAGARVSAPEQKATAGNNGDCHGPPGWTRERVGDLDDPHHVTANSQRRDKPLPSFFFKEMHRRERKAGSGNEARMRGLIEQDLVVEIRRVSLHYLAASVTVTLSLLPPWPPPSPHGRNVRSSRWWRIPVGGGAAARSPGRGRRRGEAGQANALPPLDGSGARRQTGRARGGDFFPLFFSSETELRRGAERGGGGGGGGGRQVPPWRTGPRIRSPPSDPRPRNRARARAGRALPPAYLYTAGPPGAAGPTRSGPSVSPAGGTAGCWITALEASMLAWRPPAPPDGPLPGPAAGCATASGSAARRRRHAAVRRSLVGRR